MSNFQEKSNKLFDADLSKLSYLDRVNYLDNYITGHKINSALCETYSNSVEKLKKGEYFTFILFKERFLDEAQFDAYITQNQEIKIGKPHLVVAKVILDVFKLINKDKKFKMVEINNIEDIWLLVIYQKIE